MLRLLLSAMVLMPLLSHVTGRKSKRQRKSALPPSFDSVCEVKEWAGPTLAVTEELDLGMSICDIDRLDEPPNNAEFLEKYWRKKPVLIRNYTGRYWPRTSRWSKRFLFEEFGGREVDSFDSGTNDVTYTTWKPRKLHQFLQSEVCQNRSLTSAEQLHQEYVFDRDGIFSAVPELLNDYNHPPMIEKLFDEHIHERFSRYFLVGSSMSGINFHSHTDAYNGLVSGRKRWLIYDHRRVREPPHRAYGTLRWLREVLPRVAAEEAPLQCMQEPGDLIYVPQGFWHATINLGQSIGVSGQFVPAIARWQRNAVEAVAEHRWKDAADNFKLMLANAGDSSFGASQLDVLRTKNELANVLATMGSVAEARPLYEEVRLGLTAELGASHAETLQCSSNLAVLLANTGEMKDGKELIDQVAQQCLEHHGAEHPLTQQTREIVGKIGQLMGGEHRVAL